MGRCDSYGVVPSTFTQRIHLGTSLVSALWKPGGQIILANNTVMLYAAIMGLEAESCTLGTPSICLVPRISTR